MKKAIATASALLAAFAAGAGTDGEAELRAKLPEIFAKSAAHYRALDAEATPQMNSGKAGAAVPHGAKPHGERRVPHGWNPKTGKLDMRSIYWWTSGHFPGSLWYLYEATGDEFFRGRATVWTESVAPNSKVSDNHDVGFIMYCSFGNARRLLKTDRYDDLLRETAASLSRRFNPDLGLLRSWGALDGRKDFLVIPDNMMNLEVLEWASKHPSPGAASAKGEAARFDRIARSHADVTMKHHFRADGGTYHVLDYDQKTGRVQTIKRGQGASCETAWSRGQSWAIYGYTMMYRETKDPSYLAFAQKLADFAIDNPNMPADGIPYWDYGAPGEERDSSAGAIMASGLVELSTFVPGEKGAKYRAFAVKQLLSLSSDAYFAKQGENGDWLLKHGVGNKPANGEIDVPLDYGDYYFLEGLLRFRDIDGK
ncbi:MAG: glycoside hydrolase family 88 protein [Kiritimatiellae bacterium]|nr:glycoside hydrolase family 88 protein [Kiritimatiellia bacterium]